MGLWTDVFVVGGGPAGLAAAIACRILGFQVIVADGARPPISKACGEGLLPEGVAALLELGVKLLETDGCALRGVRFEDDRASVCGRFPHDAGMGVRREVLHHRMMERARQCGISLMWSTPVTELCDEGIVAGGQKIQARWVIGADGSRSRVRRWSGLESFRRQLSRFAVRRHYRIEPWADSTEIHWSDAAQAYVTPVGVKEVCIVLISDQPNLRFEVGLQKFPKLADRLHGVERESRDRGAVTSMFHLKRVHRGNVALVGDASGSVDAITGEGLSLSFKQALALGAALAANDLKRYQVAHRNILRRPRLMGKLLLTLSGQGALRKRTLRALEAAPQLYERMLAYHVGETHAVQLAKSSAIFGWRFLTAG